MDEKDPQESPSGSRKPIEPDGGPAVVYFGDPARVREGFALALHAMGIDVSMTDLVVSDQSDKEDDHA
jgi:hypothetical protein